MSLRTMRLSFMCGCLSTVVFSGAALAGDYSRPGWYFGVGAGGASDFLDSAIEDAIGKDLIDVGSTGTFNARAGYRLYSWLALEAFYEGVYGLDIRVLDEKIASLTLHSLLANAKLILPIKRFQPYIPLGIGFQSGSFEDVADLFDTSLTDFHFRTGVGLDFYLTEHWLLNGEIGAGVRVSAFSEIGSEPTDNVTMTYSVGVQYRY